MPKRDRGGELFSGAGMITRGNQLDHRPHLPPRVLKHRRDGGVISRS